MSTLVRSIVDANVRKIEEKRIEVTIGKLPSISVDPSQMRHVVTNLIDNAIKYTGDKTQPTIRIDCEEEAQCYRFTVEDNGVGIDANQRERIFQLYHRAPEQTVAGVVQRGEGVGLAITRRIVERWGGSLNVESELGSGSSFYFTYPKNNNRRTGSS